MQIYADNAATTKMSRTAIDAMLPYLDECFGNPSSLYVIGQKAKEALEKARAEIAAVIGAEPDEIYFTFYDNSLPLMDNNDFVVTVKDIKDEHGNFSEPVMWMFHTNFASVSWDNTLLNPSTSHTKYWDQELEFVAPIYNTTGMPQTYEITGMPSWMTVEEPV